MQVGLADLMGDLSYLGYLMGLFRGRGSREVVHPGLATCLWFTYNSLVQDGRVKQRLLICDMHKKSKAISDPAFPTHSENHGFRNPMKPGLFLELPFTPTTFNLPPRHLNPASTVVGIF